MLESLCHFEVDKGRIALSCHLSLDVLLGVFFTQPPVFLE